MNCPVCSKVLPDRTAVCPECHADLSHWRPKKETVKAPPAVIIQQKDAFTWSSLRDPVAAFGKPAVLIVLVCGLLYGGYRGFMAYVLRDTGVAPEAQDAAVEPPAAEIAPDIRLSTAGFENLFQEYSARAAALNIPVLEKGALDYFQAGVNEAEGADFAVMEEAGANAAEEPFTQEELGRAGRENFACKCEKNGAFEYLAALPENNGGRSACWTVKTGAGTGVPGGEAAGANPPAEPKWVRAQWLPKLYRWSPWNAEQLINASEKFAEKTFSPAVLAEETAKTEALVRKLSRRKRGLPAGMDAAFLETYKERFRREGALAALERMRTMAGTARQPGAEAAPGAGRN